MQNFQNTRLADDTCHKNDLSIEDDKKKTERAVCSVSLAQLYENQSRFSNKTLLLEMKTLQLWHKPPA